MRERFKTAALVARVVARYLAEAVGLGLIVYGVATAWPPLGWIAGGLALLNYSWRR